MRTAAVRALRSARLLARSSQINPRSYSTVKDPTQKDPAELDQITKLPNGVRVATESLPGPFSGVGVYIDAGSRYEDESLRGVSHIMDRLAFKSTKAKSAEETIEALERLGGNVQCASAREALMYQCATFNSSVPTTIGLLAETIRDPLILEEEVEQQTQTADYEIQEIWSKPELIIPELVHMAAYKDNTLGHPLLCPRERLPFINKALIEKYRRIFYTPERTVVAFAGVKHEEAVRLAEQYFGDMESGNALNQTSADLHTKAESSVLANLHYQSLQSSSSSSSSSSPSVGSKVLSKLSGFNNFSTSAQHQATVSPLDPSRIQPAPASILNQSSHYTGGFLALPNLPVPQNNLTLPLSHVHICFEAVPIASNDIYALATLQTLLGGGGSFSAGGPGKGMYSRLYTNVLNQHGWVENCMAFNHSYTDSGLFGIAAACTPGNTGRMVDVICRELQALTLDSGFASLQTAEVNRAKNQLKFSLLMNLESRLVELEDLGRQVQIHGIKVGVKEMCQKIDDLTVQDLRKVASQVFTGRIENKGQGTGSPTVVIQEGDDPSGRVKKQISWEDVQSRIARWNLGRM